MQVRTVIQRARLMMAGIANRPELFAIRRAGTDEEWNFDPRGLADPFYMTDRPCQGCGRIVTQTECQREEEQRFGIGRTFNEREQFGVDIEQQLSLERAERGD
eukprot:gnl/MRDRNA2_/MRDRNA2_51662_c0_seq1.p2 gnl/MRDRNA2_/MRDRNA2_51662_c0~~gnl/MRDRNA2_/MRDRNA2_51662_c0_seq1.p2  ORF type:complete len:103 (-),score=3.58 gnl/MRDRNA2_/MRDRNA2_51662_c0_seq1:265-573(-)